MTYLDMFLKNNASLEKKIIKIVEIIFRIK